MNKTIFITILILALASIQTGCMLYSRISLRSDHDLCYQGFYGKPPKSNIRILNSSVTKLVSSPYPSSRAASDKKWIESQTRRATFELIVPAEWVEMHINHLKLAPCGSRFQDEYEIYDPFPEWYGPGQFADYQVYSTEILNVSTFPICELLIERSTLNAADNHIFIHYDRWPL